MITFQTEGEMSMNAPLNPSEREALARRVASLDYQMAEITSQLELHCDRTDELVVSARTALQSLENLAKQLRKQSAGGVPA